MTGDTAPFLGVEVSATGRRWAGPGPEVERMGLERRPVTDYVPRSPAGLAYQALWDEAKTKVGGLSPVVDLDSLF